MVEKLEKQDWPIADCDPEIVVNKLNELISEVNDLRLQLDGHTHYTETEETTERTYVKSPTPEAGEEKKE